MRRVLLLLLTAITLLSACKKDGIAKKDEFEASYEKLQDFKKSSGNSYTYIATSGSVFGYSSTTTVTVINGIVVGRDYKAYRLNDAHQSVLYLSFTEDKSSIGAHTQGQEALTLDQIYSKAKNEWLKVDRKANDIYFETNADGLIANCGYVPKGCQDDCFNGITILSIQATPRFVVN
ncbi:hypothetical protein [Mucilaginibacter jinjuensis]|uniref:Lipoprotein n=1 Tax=Mucilaginibacter jinjuensis TaxID=1176721 RepID=A0ABY7T103_9SPHI|nr:hypothetical protein [Mucilaginibacter jinjuensis]WCT09963.1 hypothetical protein PQO05_14620 [Mucilaginibacter jinjuensis]